MKSRRYDDNQQITVSHFGEHKRLHLESSQQIYYIISCMSNNKSNLHLHTTHIRTRLERRCICNSHEHGNRLCRQRHRCSDVRQRCIGKQRQRYQPDVRSVTYALRAFARCRSVVVYALHMSNRTYDMYRQASEAFIGL